MPSGAAAEADLVFAKDRLVDWCRLDGLPFVPFGNLDEVEQTLRRLDLETAASA